MALSRIENNRINFLLEPPRQLTVEELEKIELENKGQDKRKILAGVIENRMIDPKLSQRINEWLLEDNQ